MDEFLDSHIIMFRDGLYFGLDLSDKSSHLEFELTVNLLLFLS